MECLREATNYLKKAPSEDANFVDLKKQYLGWFKNHPSFFKKGGHPINERPIGSRDLPPFARLIGDLHHIFRAQIPKHLDVHLDEERLPQETQDLMNEFRATLALFQNKIKEIEREKKSRGETAAIYPFAGEIDPTFLAKIETSLSRIIPKFSLSKLASSPDRLAKLPIKIGTDKIEVKNVYDLGLFLFALDLSVISQVDPAKVPNQQTQEFLLLRAGVASTIPKNIVRCFSLDPKLLKQCEEAFAAFYPRAKALLHEHSHALQIVKLIAEDNTALCTGCTNLLNEAGAAFYPDKLETPLECALVLASLLNYYQIPTTKKLIEQLAEMNDGKRTYIEQHVLMKFLKTPSLDKTPMRNDSIKINLVKDFLFEQLKHRGQRKNGSFEFRVGKHDCHTRKAGIQRFLSAMRDDRLDDTPLSFPSCSRGSQGKLASGMTSSLTHSKLERAEKILIQNREDKLLCKT